MTTTCQSLVTDIRSKIVESSAQYFADSELITWLNQAYRKFIAATDWTERVTAIHTLANQFQYPLPANIIKVADCRWADQYKIWIKDLEEFGRFVGQSAVMIGPRPYLYRIFPWDQTIRIYPRPAADAVTTTVSDNPLTSGATTINIASTTGLPKYGRVLIDNEQILYYALGTNQLLQCVRGDGATTAASHVNGSTVSYAPLEIYNVYMPTDMNTVANGASADIGPITGTQYDEALIAYACGNAMIKREKYDQASFFFKRFDDLLQTAKEERKRMQLDRMWVFKDEDEYGQYYSWV